MGSLSQLVVLLLAGGPNLAEELVIFVEVGLEGGELVRPGLEAVGERLGGGQGGEGGGVAHLLEEGAEGGVHHAARTRAPFPENIKEKLGHKSGISR